MEELYLLLNDRISNAEEISTILSDLTEYSKPKPPEARSVSPIKSLEIQELSRFLNQIKRGEKVRVIKEDEIIEMVFNLKGFDLTQRQRFQEVSLEIMQQLAKDFIYKKPKATTDVKDLASLYLNFFVFSDMRSRIEDLKRVYVDNKIRGLPIISVLAKWLMELTREHFKSILKDLTQELEAFSPGVKSEKSPAKIAVNSKTGRPFNSPKEQKSGWEEIQMEKSLEETRGYEELYNFANAYKKNPKSQTQTESLDTLVKVEKINKESVRDSSPVSLSSLAVATMQIQRPSPLAFVSSVTPSVSPKHFEPLPQINRRKNPLIQVYVNVTGNFFPKHLDIIEDLDHSCNPVLNQLIGVNRNIKRMRGKNLVSVDTERKKEALGQIFKNLYFRNCDIERTVTNYQIKVWHKKKVKFFSQPKKGEVILEDLTIGYFERFYNKLIQNASLTPPINVSPSNNNKILDDTSTTEQCDIDDTKRPSTVTLLRRNRSNDSGSPIMQHSNTMAQNESIEKNLSPMIENSRSGSGRPKIDLNTGESENYFRILKVTNYLHKGTPKVIRDKAKVDKRPSDINTVQPVNMELVQKIMNSSSVASSPSEGGLSPLTMKRVTSFGQYLKKVSNGEEESPEKGNSLQLYKIKACNLIAQNEQSRNPSVDLYNKNGSLKDVGNGKDVVRFGDFIKAKQAGKTRETKTGSEAIKSQDFGKKGLELNSKQNSDTSLKNFLSFDTEAKVDTEGGKKKKERISTRKIGRRSKVSNISIGYLNKEVKTCSE